MSRFNDDIQDLENEIDSLSSQLVSQDNNYRAAMKEILEFIENKVQENKISKDDLFYIQNRLKLTYKIVL